MKKIILLMMPICFFIYFATCSTKRGLVSEGDQVVSPPTCNTDATCLNANSENSSCKFLQYCCYLCNGCAATYDTSTGDVETADFGCGNCNAEAFNCVGWSVAEFNDDKTHVDPGG